MLNKVSVIGAGLVGSKTAQRIAEKELANVVLVDIDKEIAQGKALDILTSASLEGFDSEIIATDDYNEIADSKIVVVTAGVPRKPGITREELIGINSNIVSSVAENIKKYAPDSMVILVTNPLDIMTYMAYKNLGFSSNKVFGMAGVLDTSRYKTFLSMELGVSVKDIQAMVIGCHGDEMIPLVDYTTISGIPVRRLADQETIDRIVTRTKNGGGEIVKLLKSGSAHYAPSSSIVQMVDSILKNQKRLLTVSAVLNGEYGLNDTCIGVPVIMGAEGVERIIELELNKDELEQFINSANSIKNYVAGLKNTLNPV